MEVKTFRLLITGSRDWNSREVIEKSILDTAEWTKYNDVELIVVHGDCPTGADALAQAICEDHGIKTERHPADWNEHGRAAGPIRNQEMVDLGAHECLAFPHHGSRGTYDCLRRAESADIPTRVFQDVVE